MPTEAKVSMAKFFKPKEFNVAPGDDKAKLTYKVWKDNLTEYLKRLVKENPEDEFDSEGKFRMLVQCVGTNVLEYFYDECCDKSNVPEDLGEDQYKYALRILDGIYHKPTSELSARYSLIRRKQRVSETVSEYELALKQLAKEISFRQMTKIEAKETMLIDSFVAGLTDENIRTQILEIEGQPKYDTILNKAKILERAKGENTRIFGQNKTNDEEWKNDEASVNAMNSKNGFSAFKCGNCGGSKHHKSVCPAKDKACYGCGKSGHFKSSCKAIKKYRHGIAATTKNEQASEDDDNYSRANSNITSAVCLAAVSHVTDPIITPITINNVAMKALVDSGSTHSFVDKKISQYKYPEIDCMRVLLFILSEMRRYHKQSNEPMEYTVMSRVVTGLG